MNPSREIVPLHAADVSTFCKNLRQQLTVAGVVAPGHVALLNMLAKSAGYRNFQMLKARPLVVVEAPVTEKVPEAISLPRDAKIAPAIRKLLACFDTRGRLMRWPNKFAAQQMAIWALWARLPAQRDLTEKQVNRYINDFHTYGDPATLRRELVNARLLWRTVDCRVYRKEARRPGDDVKEFLELLFSSVKLPGH